MTWAFEGLGLDLEMTQTSYHVDYRLIIRRIRAMGAKLSVRRSLHSLATLTTRSPLVNLGRRLTNVAGYVAVVVARSPLPRQTHEVEVYG